MAMPDILPSKVDDLVGHRHRGSARINARELHGRPEWLGRGHRPQRHDCVLERGLPARRPPPAVALVFPAAPPPPPPFFPFVRSNRSIPADANEVGWDGAIRPP